MKSGAPNHPKFHDLAERVHGLLAGQSLSSAAMPFAMAHTLTVGLMERLWQFTEQYAPAGDVGRFSPARIADAIGWPPDLAEAFLKAALEVRLLDRREDGVLLVHGWSDHANNGVHIFLGRRTMYFADGSMPRLRLLNSDEREPAKKAYAELERKPKDPKNRTGAISKPESASVAPPQHERGDSTPKKMVPLPSPQPQPQPQPLPQPQPQPGGGGGGGDSQAGQEPEPSDPGPLLEPPPKPGRDELTKRLTLAGVNRLSAYMLSGLPHVTPDYAAFAIERSEAPTVVSKGKFIASLLEKTPDQADGWEPWHAKKLATRAKRLDEMCGQARLADPAKYDELIGPIHAVWPDIATFAAALGETLIVGDEAIGSPRVPAIVTLERISKFAASAGEAA